MNCVSVCMFSLFTKCELRVSVGMFSLFTKCERVSVGVFTIYEV